MTSNDATCCGRSSRRVDMNAPASTVSLLHCPFCERSRWFLDGRQVDRADALGVLATVPSRAPKGAQKGPAPQAA